MPVRTVSNRGRRNVVGYFPSLKMRRMVQFESTLERDLIYLLDFDWRVAAFEEQPLKIFYQHEGKTLSYTPDFLAEFAGGHRVLLECKPFCFVNSEENQRKFSAAQAWCARRGWQFQVVTDEQLRAGYRLQNVKLLTQHARHEVGVPLKGCILAFLTRAGQSLTIRDVIVAVNPANPTTVIMPILHMAYYHELYLPLNDGPLSAQSAIRASYPAGEKGETDEYYTFRNR
ncbi:MAG: TnsA endonuclease N-terminal domain-containing protein [Chloroflexi bacterium]|nr:TnsA endonuclease N-terminal domain-containing protein [Chloroflexota bacterium]